MDECWGNASEWDDDRLDESERERRILEEERRRVHYVDGVPITGRDYPTCLEKDEFDCDICSFFSEDECRLRRSKGYRIAVWEIIQPWVERERQRQRRKEALRKAVAHELRLHGRELHYERIAEMVKERYPQFEPTTLAILRTLCSSPELFEQTSRGVYRIRSTTSVPGVD